MSWSVGGLGYQLVSRRVGLSFGQWEGWVISWSVGGLGYQLVSGRVGLSVGQ
jgi:hypothetical protein